MSTHDPLDDPRFVKASAKGNMTEAADAEAICRVVYRPSIRFVPLKIIKQQAVLS
jgi:transposase